MFYIFVYFAVPPRSIEISSHAPDATITVKEKEHIELECIVRDARPAATIVWYKNDKVLRTGMQNSFLLLRLYYLRYYPLLKSTYDSNL